MKVAINYCDKYDLDLLTSSIKSSLIKTDLWDKIPFNSKVFLKLNCVGPFDPSLGITTHPIFVRAVIQVLKEKTTNIVIGDNPATREINYTLKKCGLYNMIKEENVTIFNPEETIKIVNSNPKIYSTFEVSKQMCDVDVFINLPKLKTHTLAYMTCAQKNIFGLIVGLNKSIWHVKASNPWQFGEAINDLYGAFLEHFQDKLIINICDGIIGLEGEGPSSGGKAINSNLVLTSADAISLDRVAISLMKLNYEKAYINQIATSRNYGEGDIEKIEIVGNSLNDFSDLKFLPPKDSLSHIGLKFLKIKKLRNILLEHPKVIYSECIKCQECIKICPPNAMTFKNNVPTLKSSNCIRCWCCAEVCPKNAIQRSKRPFIGRLILGKDE